MSKVTIFGKGNMGTAIGGLFEKAGHAVSYIGSEDKEAAVGDLVVLAVPYPAVAGILENYGKGFEGKVVVDITNPVDFETFDNLVVPSDSSATAELAKAAPDVRWVKGFNTNFAASLVTGQVAGKETARVMLASDDEEAKAAVAEALAGSGVGMLDVGGLKRARELEAFGFLQISLAAQEKISWTGGFAVLD
ncbi:NADPH-dependent F420 reductase [Streptococcus dentiloxodontae]